VGGRLQGRIIDSFQVNKDGRLTRAGSLNALGPFGFSFNPVKDDHLLAAIFFAPGASSYDVSKRGTLSVISDIIDPPGVDNCWTAVTPDGKFLWTSSFIPGVLSLFSIERDGSLQFVSTHQAPDATNASDITLDAAGRFLYSLRPFPTESTKIQVKRVTKTPEINGGLQDIQDIALPPFIGADGLDTRGPIGLVIIDRPGRSFASDAE
jgi:6-phosphogluconolactonase (cycloisomerase 2 family)